MSAAKKLALCGFIPLILGYVFNFVMLNLHINGMLMLFVGAALLLLWGYLAYKVADAGKSCAIQALILNAVGLIMLLLVLYQEIVMGQYWSGFVGLAGQLYFLPLLSIASTVFTQIFNLFMPVVRIWPFYVAVWICMFAAGLIGCMKKRKNGQ